MKSRKKKSNPELQSEGHPDMLLIEFYSNALFQTPFKMMAHIKVFQAPTSQFTTQLQWVLLSVKCHDINGRIY